MQQQQMQQHIFGTPCGNKTLRKGPSSQLQCQSAFAMSIHMSLQLTHFARCTKLGKLGCFARASCIFKTHKCQHAFALTVSKFNRINSSILSQGPLHLLQNVQTKTRDLIQKSLCLPTEREAIHVLKKKKCSMKLWNLSYLSLGFFWIITLDKGTERPEKSHRMTKRRIRCTKG